MDARLETLLSRVREDHVSGAAAVAAYVAEGLADYLDGLKVDAGSVREFAFRAFRARRSMAPLFVLLNGVLSDMPDARLARRHVRSFIEEQGKADVKISRRSVETMPEGKVLTISNSSTVLKALVAVRHAHRELRVAVMESRPGGEGRRMAEHLSEAGVGCEVIADAMVFEAAIECGCAICGADCIMPGFLVNKVGTRSLLEASRAAGIPVLSLAASHKIIGVDISDLVVRSRSAGGYQTRSQVFERVPLELFNSVITEKGVAGPGEVAFPAGSYPLLDEIL